MRDIATLYQIWRETIAANELSVSITEWADKHRWLPRNASAASGQWQTAKTPYLRGIHDALSVDSPTWKIVIKGANQVGKSEAANNMVCQRIDEFPGPILWVVPRDKDVLKYVRTRFDPMFAAVPRVSALIGRDESGEEAPDNAVMKRFPGGQLIIAGSTSPAVFRSDPVEIVVLDDIDAFGANREGDIVELAAKRTNTFIDRARKFVCISTPTIDGASPIDREYTASSQRQYHVPCPHCGAYQVLEWSRLIWMPEAPTDARYKCAHCLSEIEESSKSAMVAAGDWRPQRPELVGIVEGFDLPALYSPWRRWGDIVLSFIAARRQLEVEGIHDKLQTFYNLDLAKTFVLPSRVRLEGIEMEAYKRREPPFDARILPIELVTAGVDVQANRLEASVYGWGAGLECWLLEHIVIKGAVEENGVWDELAQLVTGHGAMGMCVDAADNGQTVQDQVRRLLISLLEHRCATWCIHGLSGLRQLWPRALRPGPEKIRIGIDSAKDAIFGSLERITEPGPGYIHLPTSQSQAWFNQLFSERLATAHDRTRAKYVKIPGRRRNEALDCAVYSRAAVYALCALDEAMARVILQLDGISRGSEAREPSRTPVRSKATTRIRAGSRARSSWISGLGRGRGGGRRRR